jgi:hypothetical protein
VAARVEDEEGDPEELAAGQLVGQRRPGAMAQLPVGGRMVGEVEGMGGGGLAGAPRLLAEALDLAVREGGDAGVPVVEALPDGPQARAFLDMAGQVAGAISVQVMKAPRLPVIGAQPRA